MKSVGSFSYVHTHIRLYIIYILYNCTYTFESICHIYLTYTYVHTSVYIYILYNGTFECTKYI